MSLGKDKKDSRKYSIGNIGKWMVIGSELPIMVIAGVYIGYYLGEQFGSESSIFFIILGAVVGFLVGAFNIFKILRMWEKRDISRRIDGKESPKPSPPIEPSNLSGEVQEEGPDLSEDEKFQRVLNLLKLQVGLEDDELSSSEDDAKSDE